MYSGILEQFYFFKSKKNLWHTWHTPILAYKRWYKRIIAVPEQIFTVAQVAHYIKLVFGARDFFGFQKKHFCPKISLI